MSPILSIIIPTCDRKLILQQTLARLKNAVAGFPAEIIVVNDGKADLDSEPGIFIFKNPRKGAASARNCGAEKARGEFLLFLDDDMLISNEAVEQVFDLTRSEPKTIFLPNWEYPEKTKEKLHKTKFGRFLNRIRYTSLRGWIRATAEWNHLERIVHEGVASYFLMIRKSDFVALGKYNETFLHAGFEDYDLTERLKTAGFRFYILPRALIYHNESDRASLSGWLKRKRRNSLTQRIGVRIGYTDLLIDIKKTHALLYQMLYPFRHLLRFSAFCVPNFRLFDTIYVKHVELLTGLYMFRGYTYDYKKIEHKNQTA